MQVSQLHATKADRTGSLLSRSADHYTSKSAEFILMNLSGAFSATVRVTGLKAGYLHEEVKENSSFVVAANLFHCS